jgi:hypothetical protein
MMIYSFVSLQAFDYLYLYILSAATKAFAQQLKNSYIQEKAPPFFPGCRNMENVRENFCISSWRYWVST